MERYPCYGSLRLASYTLLQLGMASMALRYPIAVAIAYGVFLLLLRIWLAVPARLAEVLDASDAIDLADVALDGAGAVADTFSDGGGSFGGGGASADFDEPISLGLSPRPPSPTTAMKSGGGRGSGFGFDLDESALLVLIAVLILAVAGLGAALWIVWTAPALLAEVLVDGLVMTGLYRRLKYGEEPTYWLFSVVRRTWLPALVAAVLFSIAGGLLHHAVPEARSLGAAWKAVSAGEEASKR